MEKIKVLVCCDYFSFHSSEVFCRMWGMDCSCTFESYENLALFTIFRWSAVFGKKKKVISSPDSTSIAAISASDKCPSVPC